MYFLNKIVYKNRIDKNKLLSVRFFNLKNIFLKGLKLKKFKKIFVYLKYTHRIIC